MRRRPQPPPGVETIAKGRWEHYEDYTSRFCVKRPVFGMILWLDLALCEKPSSPPAPLLPSAAGAGNYPDPSCRFRTLVRLSNTGQSRIPERGAALVSLLQEKSVDLSLQRI